MKSVCMCLLVGLGLVATTGCTTTIRTISSTVTTSDGLYVGYWEGNCKPVLGCGIGDGKVQYCSLQEDNSLVCTEQDSVSRLLSRTASDD